MNVRILFQFCALVFFAGAVLGAGEYQRTKDGKTQVWNAKPKTGDQAIWFGDRDREGYATGAGTLTWFAASGNVYARYFGNMVRGKFNGLVNAHSKGKTAHAVFADGERASPWTAGRAPLKPAAEDQIAAAAKPTETKVKMAEASAPPEKIAVKPETPPNPLPAPSVPQQIETPAEGPIVKRALPAETNESTKQAAAKPPATVKAKSSFDPSLSALVGPPSSLHNIPESTQLTQQDVIGLADAEARTQGYDLDEFQRPKTDYSAASDKWTLFYDQKATEGMPQVGKYFIATVGDKTRKVSVEKKNDAAQ